MDQTGSANAESDNRYGLDKDKRPGDYAFANRDSDVEGGNEYTENGILGGGPNDPFLVRLQNREAGAVLTTAVVINLLVLIICYLINSKTTVKTGVWITLIFVSVCRYISYKKGYDYIPINQVSELNTLGQQFNDFDATRRQMQGERVYRDTNGQFMSSRPVYSTW